MADATGEERSPSRSGGRQGDRAILGEVSLSPLFLSHEGAGGVVAANFVANLLRRYHWIVYIGLLIILYVAGMMIWTGAEEVMLFMNEI